MIHQLIKCLSAIIIAICSLNLLAQPPIKPTPSTSPAPEEPASANAPQAKSSNPFMQLIESHPMVVTLFYSGDLGALDEAFKEASQTPRFRFSEIQFIKAERTQAGVEEILSTNALADSDLPIVTLFRDGKIITDEENKVVGLMGEASAEDIRSFVDTYFSDLIEGILKYNKEHKEAFKDPPPEEKVLFADSSVGYQPAASYEPIVYNTYMPYPRFERPFFWTGFYQSSYYYPYYRGYRPYYDHRRWPWYKHRKEWRRDKKWDHRDFRHDRWNKRDTRDNRNRPITKDHAIRKAPLNRGGFPQNITRDNAAGSGTRNRSIKKDHAILKAPLNPSGSGHRVFEGSYGGEPEGKPMQRDQAIRQAALNKTGFSRNVSREGGYSSGESNPPSRRDQGVVRAPPIASEFERVAIQEGVNIQNRRFTTGSGSIGSGSYGGSYGKQHGAYQSPRRTSKGQSSILKGRGGHRSSISSGRGRGGRSR